MILAAMLALLLVSFVPLVLAQQAEDPPEEGFVVQPSSAGVVDCAVPPADPADLCSGNGFLPTGYPVVVGPEILQTGPDTIFVCGRGTVPEGTLEPEQVAFVQDLCNVRFGTPLPPGYQDPGIVLGLDSPGSLQYGDTVGGPPEIARCLVRLPDGFCSNYVAPDGSIVHATPAA